jgi:hypothetical protein
MVLDGVFMMQQKGFKAEGLGSDGDSKMNRYDIVICFADLSSSSLQCPSPVYPTATSPPIHGYRTRNGRRMNVRSCYSNILLVVYCWWEYISG